MNFPLRALLASSFLLVTAYTGVHAQTVDVAELMAPGPLPEHSIGKATAPVTIVEYSSMTCTHCAQFYGEIFEPLKKKYIDTGQVRFIMREFPLDPVASMAFALPRCQPEDKYDTVIKALFAKQKDWSFPKDEKKSKKAMFKVVKPLGFTQKTFDACIADPKLNQAFTEIRNKGKDKFFVKGVPAFYVNGVKMQGEKTLEGFDKTLEPLLKKGS